MSWADVDAHLGRMHRLQPSNAAVLLSLLEGFVAADEDPSRSPNYKNQVSWHELVGRKAVNPIEICQKLCKARSAKDRVHDSSGIRHHHSKQSAYTPRSSQVDGVSLCSGGMNQLMGAYLLDRLNLKAS